MYLTQDASRKWQILYIVNISAVELYVVGVSKSRDSSRNSRYTGRPCHSSAALTRCLRERAMPYARLVQDDKNQLYL